MNETKGQPPGHAAIDETVSARRELTAFGAAIRAQPFWVMVAIVVIGIVMSTVSDVFMTERNMYNVTRNFAFFGIMALGMTAVIITAGIDLSVGSLMGLTGIAAAMAMNAGYSVGVGFVACMGTAVAVGLIMECSSRTFECSPSW